MWVWKVVCIFFTHVFTLQVYDWKCGLHKDKWGHVPLSEWCQAWGGLNSARILVQHIFFFALYSYKDSTVDFRNVRPLPSQEPTFPAVMLMYSPGGWTLHFWVHLQNCCEQWLLALLCLSSVCVCPSSCMEQLSFHWTDFREILFLLFVWKTDQYIFILVKTGQR